MKRLTLITLLVAILTACSEPTHPIPGRLTVEAVQYFPRTGRDLVDSAIVLVRVRWIPGQLALNVAGAQWVQASIAVVTSGDAVVPVTLRRYAVPPLTFPDTITVTAVNLRGAQAIQP